METQSKKIAAVYMLLSSLSFAFMQLFVKLTAGEIPLFEQIFIRNFVILWMMLFILHKNKSLDKLKIKEGKGILLIRSISGFMGITLFFYAMRTIHLADAAALQKMSPFFVMLFSAIILKEKLTRTKLIALVTSFLGVLFIVKPAFDSGVIPSVLALLSAVFAGLAYTMIAFMKNKVHSHAIIFYFSAFCCLACIPFMIGNFVVPSPTSGFYLLLIGVMGGFGQSFLTAAYKLAPAGEVSVYNYSNIIFSAIFGLAFFGEILDNFSLVGIILIIASGIGVYVYNKE